MLLASYEYPWSPRQLRVFSGRSLPTMLSGNGVKTVRCSYDQLCDPLRLKMLSGNGAQDCNASVVHFLIIQILSSRAPFPESIFSLSGSQSRSYEHRTVFTQFPESIFGNEPLKNAHEQLTSAPGYSQDAKSLVSLLQPQWRHQRTFRVLDAFY